MYNWQVCVDGKTSMTSRFTTKRAAMARAEQLKAEGYTGHVFNLKTIKTVAKF